MNLDPRSVGLPNLIPDRSTLFLTTPLARTESRLRDALQKVGLHVEEPFPGVLRVTASSAALHRLSHEWMESLNQVDLQLTKCRLDPSGIEPTHSELMQTTTLSVFIAWIDAQWLGDVLKDRRLATYFQPIVRTSKPSEVFAYECLLRGLQEDGDLISPDRLYGAARAAGMLHNLDQVARLTAIESSANRKIDTRVFINFNPRSISDPEHCLQSTVAAIEASGIAHQQFVFEVVESDEIVELDDLLQILQYFRSAGIGVALDDMGAGYSSLNLLARIKPDFIKLDMGLIRNVHRDPYKSRVASKLLELARDLGVQTVVEGVEDAGEWNWATFYGADYAQGYLFSRPHFEPPPSSFHGDHLETPTEAAGRAQREQAEDTAAVAAAVGLNKN